LDYDPKTGYFTWRSSGRGRFRRQGELAGSINKKRRYIMIDQERYLASRLAFFWMRGRWPKHLIDHKNRIRNDDRWPNLREATRSQNNANSVSSRHLPKGVYWDKTSNKYLVLIKVNGYQTNLGRFSSIRAAHAAYRVAAKKHFGAFARFS
jgi:hypothetical protein